MRTLQKDNQKWRELLHRMVMGRMEGRKLESYEQVDHIDGNGLNNQRSNLRIATSSQNKDNTSIRADNTSGYKGVAYNARARKYFSYVNHNGKRHYLGYFSTAREAWDARCKKAAELHGEFVNNG